MSKIKILLLNVIILASGGLYTSCSDFLEVSPSSEIPKDGAFGSITEAKAALNGVYLEMATVEYYGTEFVTYGDVRGEDMGTRKGEERTKQQYLFGHATALNSTNAGEFWTETIYTVLNRTNYVIENVKDGKLPANSPAEQKVIDDILGQAYALRAIAHFDLVRIYGEPYLKNKSAYGVVLADKVLSKSDLVDRATVEATYTFILGDITTALGLLDDTSTGVSPATFNYWGVKALAARVYLHMGDYENAYTSAKAVVTSGNYSLIPNASYASSWGQEFTTESIFEIHQAETSNGDRESIGALASPGSGIYGCFILSEQFIDLLNEDPDDVRQTITYYNAEYDATYMSKYPGRGGNIYVNNSRVLRLSDVYLMAAEAGLKAGKSDFSTFLNDIRLRANPAATPVTATLDLIEKERRKELVGEGHRFFDIIRDMSGNKVVKRNGVKNNEILLESSVPELSWTNKNAHLLILPIPQAQIDITPDMAAQQNAGYK